MHRCHTTCRATCRRRTQLLFIVVDAGLAPSGDWQQREDGPSGLKLAGAAIDAATATNVRMSYDAFVRMLRRWRDDIVAYRCAMPNAR